MPPTITNTRVTVDISEYVLAARARGDRQISLLMWRPMRNSMMPNSGTGSDIPADDLNKGSVVTISGIAAAVPAASRPSLTLL